MESQIKRCITLTKLKRIRNMKKLRKALSLLAALAALGGGLLTSCSGDDETVIVKPSYEAEPSIRSG